MFSVLDLSDRILSGAPPHETNPGVRRLRIHLERRHQVQSHEVCSNDITRYEVRNPTDKRRRLALVIAVGDI